MAEIRPTATFDRAKAKAAADWIRSHFAKGPRVTEEEAQRNWELLKEDLDRDLDERMARWSKS